jgi:hypothetical protein
MCRHFQLAVVPIATITYRSLRRPSDDTERPKTQYSCGILPKNSPPERGHGKEEAAGSNPALGLKSLQSSDFV